MLIINGKLRYDDITSKIFAKKSSRAWGCLPQGVKDGGSAFVCRKDGTRKEFCSVATLTSEIIAKVPIILCLFARRKTTLYLCSYNQSHLLIGGFVV